jgi:hypothetical protein
MGPLSHYLVVLLSQPAPGTPAELIAQVGGEHVIDLELDPATSDRPENGELLKLPKLSSVREEGNKLTLTAGEPHRALPALLDYLRGCGVKLVGLTTRTATLEDVFVTLTGRHLRDDGEQSRWPSLLLPARFACGCFATGRKLVEVLANLLFGQSREEFFRG